jgi:hypothetical protein
MNRRHTSILVAMIAGLVIGWSMLAVQRAYAGGQLFCPAICKCVAAFFAGVYSADCADSAGYGITYLEDGCCAAVIPGGDPTSDPPGTPSVYCPAKNCIIAFNMWTTGSEDCELEVFVNGVRRASNYGSISGSVTAVLACGSASLYEIEAGGELSVYVNPVCWTCD